jgi:serine/threonine protein kinase
MVRESRSTWRSLIRWDGTRRWPRSVHLRTPALSMNKLFRLVICSASWLITCVSGSRFVCICVIVLWCRYRAPECLLTDGYYDYKMDLFGIGCVFFEVVALFPLFPGANELDQIEKIHAILGTPPKELQLKFKRYSIQQHGCVPVGRDMCVCATFHRHEFQSSLCLSISSIASIYLACLSDMHSHCRGLLVRERCTLTLVRTGAHLHLVPACAPGCRHISSTISRRAREPGSVRSSHTLRRIVKS